MVISMYLQQNPIPSGGIAVFDMMGFSLAHLGKLNLMAIKQALYYVQVRFCTFSTVASAHIMI
jgi:hypothetical protein